MQQSRLASVFRLKAKIKHALAWRLKSGFEIFFGFWLRRFFDWSLRPKGAHVLSATGPALIFAPHADDETLGCGGLIALRRQQHIPVTVAFLTDGAACYQDIVFDDNLVMPSEDVVALRQQEAISALGQLGLDEQDVHFFKRPDGDLAHQLAEDREALISQLVALLDQVSPSDVYVTCRCDVHSDHRAAYQLVQEAVRRWGKAEYFWEYPIWSFWHSQGLFELMRLHRSRLFCLPIRAVLEQKQAAIQCYQSQIQHCQGTRSPVLSAKFISYFSSVESEVFLLQKF
jgi:N-acetylglucosamine malate deacetylase 1